MKVTPIVIAVAMCLEAGAAFGAAPDFGSREGELACAGLVNLGLAGAVTSNPSYPQVVNAIVMALGFYLGRLSKIDPEANKEDMDRALTKLTLEEKNTYANECLKRAALLMGPTLH